MKHFTKAKRITKSFILFILLFACIAIFTACGSTDKNECQSAISKNVSSEYNSENNTTRFDFSLYFKNGTIYNMTKEDITFGLYKDNHYVKSVEFSWNCKVKADNILTTNTYIIVDGQFDRLEVEHWSPTYDNLWNTYKTWWIIAIVVAIVLVLFLIFYGVRALLEYYGINPFKSVQEKMSSKKEERYYQTLAKDIQECIEQKRSLNEFYKDDLSFYCYKKGIVANGERKADLIDAIVADINGDTSVGNADEQSKTTQKTKDKNAITFDDIAGLERAKESFREKVILPFEHPELYKKFGKKAGGGILLYGLPGTGKTMFAEAAANEVDALFLPIKCSDIKSKWYGESEQKVKEVFVKARKSKKAIIFFDEFESIGSKRTDNSDNANNDLVPEILAEMQGVESSKCESTIVVIAATNKPWMIDSAFLRPGRFDEKIYIPLPDEIAREKLFQLKLKDVPTMDLDFVEMARMTDGYNGADISEVCEKLKMKGINQSIKDGVEHFITMDDFAALSKEMKSSVSQEDVIRFEEFERN